MPTIRLPNNWQPRPKQRRLWKYLEQGGKRAVAVWHRRFGKDDVSLHWTAVAAMQRVGTYWHLLPEAAQARKAIWDAVNPHTGKRRIDEAFPAEIRETTKDHEMFIRFKNGSTWQVVGSDNYNSLVGSPPIGVVFSEWSLANPAAWAYLLPILTENGGWAIFIYTPRGANHGKRTYESAKERPGWFAEILTVDDTNALTADALAEALVGYQDLYGQDEGDAFFQQEFYCSFSGAILGSIFGKEVEKARREGRIGIVPHEPWIPVHTGWDLGRTDDTAIWWFQVFAGEVRILHYHASNGKDIPFYCELLDEVAKERGFTYGKHYLPHDAKPVTLASGGKSILQQFVEWNRTNKERLGTFKVLHAIDKQDQIQAGRATLAKSWIDSEHCADGIEALINYRREWDEERRVFSLNPVHDWASHPADGWMTLSRAWKSAPNVLSEAERTPQPGIIVSKSISASSFGQLKNQHLRAAKRARNPFG